MIQIAPELEGEAVSAAARCLLVLYPSKQDGRHHGLETSQLRNFLEVAQASRDVRSIETWIRYQMGRSGDNKGWCYGEGSPGKTFGETVIEEMRQLGERLPSEARGLASRQYLRLICIFAGQLARLFAFAEAKEVPAQERRAALERLAELKEE